MSDLEPCRKFDSGSGKLFEAAGSGGVGAVVSFGIFGSDNALVNVLLPAWHAP